MAGRRWYDGPVRMDFTLYAPEKDLSLTDFAGGVQDTLDGSHGCEFTYLPIVYQDDCQICDLRMQFIESERVHYIIKVTFLGSRSEMTRRDRH
jgi:hypothetical protein